MKIYASFSEKKSALNRVLCLICGLVFGAQVLVSAQNLLISDPLSIRNDYGYELVGRLRDRILLFRDKYDDFEVQAYDLRMQISWSRELEDIEKRGTQILAVIGSKNDFSVIYKTKRRGSTFLRIHKYDPAANLIDSMMVKNYGERLFEGVSLEIVRSEDRNCFVVYNKAARSVMELTCFRLDKMQMLWDQSVTVDNNLLESKTRGMVVSNAGEFFWISEENNRRSKLDEHEYKVLNMNYLGENTLNIPLQRFLTNGVQFTYDNLNKRLTGAGLYAEKNRERANGTFYVSMAGMDSSAMAVQFAPFDDRFLSIWKGKEVEEDKKGIADMEVQSLVLRRDGGVILLGEQVYEVQRGATANRGFMRDGVRLVVDYYYNDFFAVALDPKGLPQWKTILHKKQYSQDDDGTFSSFFTMRTPDNLRFLFNDEIKYENTCSEYVVSPLGDFDRNSLLNTENQTLRLRFRDALQLSATEVLIPSEYRNKMRLVLLQYPATGQSK